MSTTMRIITGIILLAILAVVAAMFAGPAFAGLDEVDYQCGWDRTSSGAGYRYAVSKGNSPTVHNPSPPMTISVAKALHTDAQDGQAVWVSSLPSGVSTWYTALTSAQRDAVYACELYRPAYQ